MRKTSWMVVAGLALALCVVGCKKKTGANSKPPQIEEQEAGALQPEPGPAKIDPEAEASDPPMPAVADLVDDDDDPEEGAAQAAPIPRKAEEYSAGATEDVQFVRLFADGFGDLKRRQRVLVYHLARAILAGRDIIFDQLHRDGLEIRQLLECVLRNGKADDPALADALEKYHLEIGIHSGVYNRLTGRKFVPTFTYEQFSQAVKATHASGTDMRQARDEPLEGMLARLKRVVFDPDYQPELFKRGKRSRGGVDGSVLNLYRNVSAKALKHFDEHYPHNSRLIAIDGRLVEEVYRAGDKRRRIGPGRYATELRRVLKRLGDAVSSADRKTRMYLGELIEHFRTGDPFAFDAALRRWQSDLMEVEFLVGFVDHELDPRGQKGLWTGLVGIGVQGDTARLASMLRSIQDLEDRMPWKDSLRKRFKDPPQAAAVQLITSVGRTAPDCRLGYRLPPDRAFGERNASKVLLFVNAVEAHQHAVLDRVVQTFLAADAQARAQEKLAEVAFARAALREVIGRELGRVSASVDAWSPTDLATIEALKAELVALWLLAEPKVRELGITTSRDVHLAAWDVAMAELASAEALAPEGLVDPDARAKRILARAMLEQDAGVTVQEAEAGPSLAITDQVKFKAALAELLVRCARILADADRQAARQLMRQYAGAGTWPQRAAYAERARQAGLRPMVICILPKLKPLRGDRPGRFIDASISYTEDFARQLLRIARY